MVAKRKLPVSSDMGTRHDDPLAVRNALDLFSCDWDQGKWEEMIRWLSTNDAVAVTAQFMDGDNFAQSSLLLLRQLQAFKDVYLTRVVR